MSNQDRMPLCEALLKYKERRVVPFDVPGHKQGRGNAPLRDFFGAECLKLDVNSSKPLDNLCHPTSVIRESELLAAEAFGSHTAFFMVGGTTSAVQAMIMTACKEGEKIIMPRNVHRSAINAVILCGAVPIYVNPGVDKHIGIPLGMSTEDVRSAIKKNPDAKAVFVNNPTYYGICSDLQGIIKIAHENKMLVLADEAHGTHLYFGENLPPAAMKSGADMSSVSMHKTGGSLTQSSLLLASDSVDSHYIRQIINLTQTTSASYLLMSSLDISRRNLALNGKKIFREVSQMAEYARTEINRIGGYYAFSTELADNRHVFGFDTTKLSIYTRDIGLAGIEVYDTLRDDYNIQIEFGDLANILAIISVGDRSLELERLISALSEIKRIKGKTKAGLLEHEYITPIVKMTPKQAFCAESIQLPIGKTVGYICSEFVMCYPPGIPILAPGEQITDEILQYISYAKDKGCSLTGTRDMSIETLAVLPPSAS